MPTLPPKPNRTLPPEGTHIARCIQFIHIGSFKDEYQGKPILANKIRLTFELPEETHVFLEGDDPKPFVISQEYSLSMGKKSNLRSLVEGIVGALFDDDAYNFDTEKLVGKSCLITIKYKQTVKGATYAMITGATPLMKGQVCKEAFNELKILTYEKWSDEEFMKLPDFIREKMMKTDEYKKLKGIKVDETIEDVPF